MIKEAIIRLSKKEDLSYTEAEEVMNEIMEGKASPIQISSYLTALSLKGETISEITASAAGMRAHCIKLLHACSSSPEHKQTSLFPVEYPHQSAFQLPLYRYSEWYRSVEF